MNAYDNTEKQKKYFNSRDFLLLYPLLIVIGKIVRWTIMKVSLVNLSKGWGYPDVIVNGNWSWQFFGIDELIEGDIGQGGNIYSFF
ncbi:MAG: hypothetical protein LUH47_06900 [Clostridiales bacterium]|nr:hypothetical protein [Clostridiales bacterium]